MSSSVFIVYIPALLYIAIPESVNLRDIAPVLFEMAALDSVLAGILIIYFVPAVRQSLMSFGRNCRRKGDGQVHIDGGIELERVNATLVSDSTTACTAASSEKSACFLVSTSRE
ncbi:UNVERIFIED_CONTAM: hypothetical protein HDU68_006039 [Siphonaria sp. JEL0065]|nr:hypothetical protein HDU68_006039 [Siphonaria sp. JEL0065]